MTQIRINTELAQETAQRLARGGSQLVEIDRVLRGAVGSLDTSAWDGVSRSRAEPLLSQVGSAGGRLVAEITGLGQTLARTAEAFARADQAAARSLAGMPWVEWGGGSSALPPGDVPPGDNPDLDGVRGAEGAVYAAVEGESFIPGAGDAGAIHPNDVHQGRLGDCYFLASLATIADQNPALIERMVHDNGDGTYTVTFYRRNSPFAFWQPDFSPVEVTVTPDFPLDHNRPLFAQPGDAAGSQQELWTMLVEKAYASYHGGYHDIEGGWGHTAMEELTGTASDWYAPSAIDLDTLAAYSENGYGMTASSMADWEVPGVVDIPDQTDLHPLYVSGDLAANHEYYVSHVDRELGTITLRNPWGWGWGETTLSFEEFQATFRRVSVNPLTP
ncbi:MAG: WXG100 family type VII secretion target [Anaerolineae bacterium]|nr:WXG100 family type VII secretion target [Anaerolineae bacterium]